MPSHVVAVQGYRQFLRACARAEPDTKKAVTEGLKGAGEAVRADAAEHFTYSTTTAAGFKVRARQRGVAVYQSKRKTTGLRPDYGALQMRVLLRARAANTENTEKLLEQQIDKVCDVFEH